MWSSSVEVEHVIRVGSLRISANENVWEKSLPNISNNSKYFFTKAELEFLGICDWFSFRINFSF